MRPARCTGQPCCARRRLCHRGRPAPPHRRPRARRGRLPARQRVRPGPATRPGAATTRSRAARRRRRHDPARSSGKTGPDLARAAPRCLRRGRARRRRQRRRPRRRRGAPGAGGHHRHAAAEGARSPRIRRRARSRGRPGEGSRRAAQSFQRVPRARRALRGRAHARQLLAEACAALGDHETAGMESRAASAVLDALAKPGEALVATSEPARASPPTVSPDASWRSCASSPKARPTGRSRKSSSSARRRLPAT